MIITFTAHPIETAPKDRQIMLFSNGIWFPGNWLMPRNSPRGYWVHARRGHETKVTTAGSPTHWAEVEDMRPAEPVAEVAEFAMSECVVNKPAERHLIDCAQTDEWVERHGWAVYDPNNEDNEIVAIAMDGYEVTRVLRVCQPAEPAAPGGES